MRHRITINGKPHYFPTLEAASARAGEIFKRTGIVVGVEAAPVRQKPWEFKGCTITPETMSEPILAGCNNSVNRYLKTVWRITFPNKTWCRVGTKDMARGYINSRGHSYGVTG
jgi:hypothetical protein